MVFPIIFVLFVAVPILEIYLLIKVGSAIGALATIAIVILTAVLGTWMLRSQGLSTLAKAQNRLSGGEVPAFEMMEGLALGVGGALLLTPGFITDAIGFVCLVPFTRRMLVQGLSKRVSVGSVAGGFSASVSSGGRPPFNNTSNPSQKNASRKPSGIEGDVIEGEYTRKD